MSLTEYMFILTLFLCLIFQAKVNIEKSWQATEKARDMPYGDSVLLPLFIVHFQCFDLKHFYFFLLPLTFLKPVAACFYGFLFNENLVILISKNCQIFYLSLR